MVTETLLSKVLDPAGFEPKVKSTPVDFEISAHVFRALEDAKVLDALDPPLG